jgi:hypothetical protein
MESHIVYHYKGTLREIEIDKLIKISNCCVYTRNEVNIGLKISVYSTISVDQIHTFYREEDKLKSKLGEKRRGEKERAR